MCTSIVLLRGTLENFGQGNILKALAYIKGTAEDQGPVDECKGDYCEGEADVDLYELVVVVVGVLRHRSVEDGIGAEVLGRVLESGLVYLGEGAD